VHVCLSSPLTHVVGHSAGVINYKLQSKESISFYTRTQHRSLCWCVCLGNISTWGYLLLSCYWFYIFIQFRLACPRAWYFLKEWTAKDMTGMFF